MRENKRKKISNKPICPACGAVITVRCETWHNRLGRCLRHSNHTGPHYFAAKSIQDDPTFWEALQDPWSVVYFPKPEKVGRNEKGGELERDSRYAGERKLLDLVEGNARVIDEIYCLVDSISKGIALVLTMLERKGVELEYGELEGDPGPRHAVEHHPPAGDGELEKRIEETSQRILIIEKALNGIAGSLEKMVLLSGRTIEKLDLIETVVLKMAGHYLGKIEP